MVLLLVSSGGQVMEMASTVLGSLGLSDAQLQLNTLGDQQSRTKYKALLTRYFDGCKELLSEDSKARLERGAVSVSLPAAHQTTSCRIQVLRILDSKSDADQPLINQVCYCRLATAAECCA